MLFTEIFNCKYPISVMAMNQVSDANLAVAVRKAGCLPSLSIFNYFIRAGIIDLTLLENEIVQYKDAVGDTSVLISTDIGILLDFPELMTILLAYKVRAVEIIMDDQHPDAVHRRRVILPLMIKQLQDNSAMVFTKVLHPNDVMAESNGIILKGADGAGRGNMSGETLEQLFDKFKLNFPLQQIITSGGVGTSAQLKYYMDRGAFGVGIGTMFAVSAESKISTATKLKLVASGAADVKRLDNGKTDNNSQNAVIFAPIPGDNHNNTRGLMAGIRNPIQGHVFIGRGIEHANEILTCEQIVQRLVKDL